MIVVLQSRQPERKKEEKRVPRCIYNSFPATKLPRSGHPDSTFKKRPRWILKAVQVCRALTKSAICRPFLAESSVCPGYYLSHRHGPTSISAPDPRSHSRQSLHRGYHGRLPAGGDRWALNLNALLVIIFGIANLPIQIVTLIMHKLPQDVGTAMINRPESQSFIVPVHALPRNHPLFNYVP